MVDEGILQAVKQSYADHYHLRELKADLGGYLPKFKKVMPI